MYTVVGMGSVGTVLAALLADAGRDVAAWGRGAVPDLVAEGDGETVRARVPVVDAPRGTLLLCVHEPDVADVCARYPRAAYVTFQNGVASEAAAAAYGDVIGGVWRMTCTLRAPGAARFTRRGRVVVGRHPAGRDAAVDALARDLAACGLDAGISPEIARDKWLKLFVNLTSAPNALIRPADHGAPAFGAVKAALLEEARDVFAAAGIDARSCDGRDASLDEEIERQRRGGGRARPVYNSTWRQLAAGRRPKERYHDVVVRLAAEHGAAAPRNAAMLRLLDAATAPESLAAADVLTTLETSRGT